MQWKFAQFGFLARAATMAAVCMQAGAPAQQPAVPDAPAPVRSAKPFPLPEQLPEKATLAAAVTIPVGPLGFTAPAAFYLGQRNSLASLDFLDENHLLFSFRVPGLIRRQAGAAGDEERQIKAVVLALPAGTVEAEAIWTVHDRARYLWPLENGRFLMRDGGELKQGDSSLGLKPFLRLPGPVLWLEADPSGQYLVTDSREPQAAEKNGDPAATPQANAQVEAEGQNPAAAPEVRVRILRRDTGKVMLTSRVRTSVRLPINGEGYLEPLRVSAGQWVVALNRFAGGTATLGRVDSACTPYLEFLAPDVALATGCTSSGEALLTAMTADGRRLWQAEGSERSIWPLVQRSIDGRRMLRETLMVSHGVSAHAPLDTTDIKGQLVLAMNTVDGQTVLAAPAAPVLDGGGNAALSPSGRRAAVLHAGALEVYDLPAPPDLPMRSASR